MDQNVSLIVYELSLLCCDCRRLIVFVLILTTFHQVFKLFDNGARSYIVLQSQNMYLD